MTEKVLKVPAGSVLFEEGSSGTHMFVVVDGRLEVSRIRGDLRIVLNVLERGAFFGELALLEALPRSATVTAVEDATLNAIDSAALMARLAADPLFGLRMFQRLAALVRRMSDELMSLALRTQPLDDSQVSKLAEIEYGSPGYL